MALIDALDDFMTDRCVIRDAGTGALDRATGALAVTDGSVRYEGRCNIQDRPSTVDGRDGSSTVDEHEIRVPAGTEGLAVGQYVTIEGDEPTDWIIHRLTTRSLGLTARFIVRRRTGRQVVA